MLVKIVGLLITVVLLYILFNIINYIANPTTFKKTLQSSAKWALIVYGIVLLIPVIIYDY